MLRIYPAINDACNMIQSFRLALLIRLILYYEKIYSSLTIVISGSLFSQTQLGIDIDGESFSDESGWAVSMSSDGTIVAIGAVCNDENGSYAGHVKFMIFQQFLDPTR